MVTVLNTVSGKVLKKKLQLTNPPKPNHMGYVDHTYFPIKLTFIPYLSQNII